MWTDGSEEGFMGYSWGIWGRRGENVVMGSEGGSESLLLGYLAFFADD